MAVIDVNKDSFLEEVVNNKSRVLVDFNADWCGPCRMLKPIIDEISESREDIKIISVNIDDNDDLAEEYNVSSIPCLVLFEDGKEVKRNVGFISKDAIESFIGE